jgi:hypothetical protein
MSATPGIMVKINGSPDLVAELQDVAAAKDADLVVKSAGPAEEASHLRLGLGDIATLVAVLNGVATFAKFAYAIYKHLSDKKSEQVTVQTPLRTVVIVASDATSPERIKALLDGAMKV